MSTQAPSVVVMVRPCHFQANTAAAADNAFQTLSPDTAGTDIVTIEHAVYQEVTEVATALADAGITVHLFEDEST